jgi:hypothetical protein
MSQSAKFSSVNANIGLIRFGYTNKQAALLNVPSGALAMVAVILGAWFAGRTNNRGLGIAILLCPGILGGGLMAFLPAHNKVGKLFGIYLTGTFGASKFSTSSS